MLDSTPKVAVATIYKLVDPRTLDVRYVGVTSNPNRRKLDHGNPNWQFGQRADWIRELRSLSLKPIFLIIQEVPVTMAGSAELYWIRRYQKYGYPLLNVDGMNSGHGYKSPVKKFPKTA